MGARGKESVASLTVVQTGVEKESRLVPSAYLTPDQRQVWLETVNARPATWFAAHHKPLLESYCRHVLNARLAAHELSKFTPEDLADDAGVKRFKTLTQIHELESRAITSLATKMRLTQQSLDKTVAAVADRDFRPDVEDPWAWDKS